MTQAATHVAAPLIQTRGLSKTFRVRGKKGKSVEAVRGVDLTVRAGEIFGFLGPNGAGKSTTMRMLTTLVDPTGGEATVCGYDLRRQPARVRRQIGYVSQKGGAEPMETGRENLELQGGVYGMSKTAAKRRAAELIARLEMESFADRYVRTLSGGQRRRLDVALGIMHRPQLLFLDEPTTGLDPQSRARIWDEIRSLHADGMTLFLTTHYMDEADDLCDRLAIIDNGRIVSEDSPTNLKRRIAGDIISLGLEDGRMSVTRVAEELRAQPFVREIQPTEHGIQLYVDRGEEMLPSVLRLLDQRGVTIRTVTLARPTLEDVFLRMTGRSLRDDSAQA
jgi:ABC-2 type transport system ATP-binding protein